MQDWRRSTWALIARGKMSVNFDQDPTDLMFPLRRILYSSLSLSLSLFFLYLFLLFSSSCCFLPTSRNEDGEDVPLGALTGENEGKRKTLLLLLPLFLSLTFLLHFPRSSISKTERWSSPRDDKSRFQLTYGRCRPISTARVGGIGLLKRKKKRLGSDFFSFFFLFLLLLAPGVFR